MKELVALRIEPELVLLIKKIAAHKKKNFSEVVREYIKKEAKREAKKLSIK